MHKYAVIKTICKDPHSIITQIYDEQFICDNILIIPAGTPFSQWLIVPAVFSEYKNRNLQVAHNVARLYLYWYNDGIFSINKLLINDSKNMFDYFPEMEYKKYFQCIQRQLNRMIKQ